MNSCVPLGTLLNLTWTISYNWDKLIANHISYYTRTCIIADNNTHNYTYLHSPTLRIHSTYMEQITNMQASYQTLYFSQVMMQDDAAHPLTQGYLCRAEELMDTIKTIDYHHARRYTTTHSTHHTPPTTLVWVRNGGPYITTKGARELVYR